MRNPRIQARNPEIQTKNPKVWILSCKAYSQADSQKSNQESNKNPKLKNFRAEKTLQILVGEGVSQESRNPKCLQKISQILESGNSTAIYLHRPFLRIQPHPPPLHGGYKIPSMDGMEVAIFAPHKFCTFINNEIQTNMNNKKILALDLGTKTGWAIRSENNQITSGTIEFKPGRYEGGGMRYLRFRKWLDEVNQLIGNVDQIYFEEVRRHLGVDAAHAYGGFLAHLASWCEERKIPYLGIPVGTIKKHITGKGNASKDQIISGVKKLGFNPTDDNESDALALLDLVLKKHEGGVL